MLDTQGAISVYRPAPSPQATPTLVFKSDSNVMIMYGNIYNHIYTYLLRSTITSSGTRTPATCTAT